MLRTVSEIPDRHNTVCLARSWVRQEVVVALQCWDLFGFLGRARIIDLDNLLFITNQYVLIDHLTSLKFPNKGRICLQEILNRACGYEITPIVTETSEDVIISILTQDIEPIVVSENLLYVIGSFSEDKLLLEE